MAESRATSAPSRITVEDGAAIYRPNVSCNTVGQLSVLVEKPGKLIGTMHEAQGF